MRNMIPNRKEKGFTLIELVMVIVILGILAAFALPRFADFGSEAKVATLNGAAGSVRSAAAIAHSRWVADGSDTTEGNTIDLDGASGITMSTAGYPTANDSGIGEAAQLSDEFSISAGPTETDGTVYTITFDEGTDCNFTYDESTGDVSVNSGCS